MAAYKLHTVFDSNPGKPVLVFSDALGCTHAMWRDVITQLSDSFDIVSYDARGHGASPDAAEPFSIADMADDAAALIQSLGKGEVHFCGLSMGGMVAQSLASRYPQLVNKIIIANSCGYYDEAAQAMWAARVKVVNEQGMMPVLEPSMQRWFSAGFIASNAAEIAAQKQSLGANKPSNYALSSAAVGQIDFRNAWPNIKAPTLLIAGELDVATPPAASQLIAANVPNAKVEILNGAAHLSAVEMPQAFARLVKNFLLA